MIRFSVCIPNYNYARFLGRTIQSALDQTLAPHEVIVSDNASTDDSVAVVEVAMARSDRVRLFRNPINVGFAPNLQRATALARGDFLILLSSDDVMRPEALATYAEVLGARGDRVARTVLTAATDYIDAEDRVTHVQHCPPGSIMTVETPIAAAGGIAWPAGPVVHRGLDVLRASLVHGRSPAPFLATAYPRVMWEEVAGYDTTYHNFPDSAFLHKLLALDPDFVYVPRRLFGYRLHEGSQTAKALAQSALRRQVDGYMRAVNYPQAVLDRVGLTRRDLQRLFVDTICLDEALTELAAGRRARAFKIGMFAHATYPGAAVRNWKSLALAALLALGPVGSAAARAARRHRRLP